MILLDTSGLLAAIDRKQRRHAEAARTLREWSPPRLLSPFILAELDYLLATRVGMGPETELLAEVGRGAYQLETFSSDDVDQARLIIQRYASLGLGLADASLVVLAQRHDTVDLLTLDERHFRAVEGPGGKPFRLLPGDGAA